MALILQAIAGCTSGGGDTAGADPCQEGYVAYDESGHQFASLEEVQEVAGSSLVLHICEGTHKGALTIIDDMYDGEDAVYSIVGAGESTTILDGGGETGLLYLLGGTYTVSDLTIRNGGFDDVASDGGLVRTAGAGVGLVRGTALFERVTISGNEADDGAGMVVNAGASATLRGSSVIDNSAEHGGGVVLRGAGSTLVSEESDWGQGGTDNRGGDIAFVDDDVELGSADYDGTASFSCSWDTLVCE